MLCAAIDIGSNTTRVLVAEPVDGQLKKVMEQRAYTRINKALDSDGAIVAGKTVEVCEVVATQVRLAKELGAEEIRAVATAAVREASNSEAVAEAIGEAAGVPVEVLSDEEEGRLSFIGATKTLGHPVAGKVGVVDVGGGSTEVILGTVPGGASKVLSWRVGSGVLADELISSDPPSAAEIRKVELDCEASFGAAARRVVKVRAREVFKQADGVLDLGEVERVHDMRVATRRLRAALEVFEDCFPPKRHRKALKKVKALADALGERRDADVEIEMLEGLAGEVAAADRRALEASIAELRARQRRANEDLAPFVTAKRLKKLRRRLAKLVKAAKR